MAKGPVRMMALRAPTVTAPTGPVAFSGNPPISPAYGTSDPGAVFITYQVDSNPPTNIPFDPSTGTWNMPYLTTIDCPTINTEYTLTITAYYPPPPPPMPPPIPPPPPQTGTSIIGQQTFTRTS